MPLWAAEVQKKDKSNSFPLCRAAECRKRSKATVSSSPLKMDHSQWIQQQKEAILRKKAACRDRFAKTLDECGRSKRFSGEHFAGDVLVKCRSDVDLFGLRLKQTKDMASDLCRRIRRLEKTQTRTLQCIQHLNQLSDLRSCMTHLKESVHSMDADKVAKHLAQFKRVENMAALSQFDFDGLKTAAEVCKEKLLRQIAERERHGGTADVVRCFRKYPSCFQLKACALLNEAGFPEESLSRAMGFVRLVLKRDFDLLELRSSQTSGDASPVDFVDLCSSFINCASKIFFDSEGFAQKTWGERGADSLLRQVHSVCDVTLPDLVKQYIDQRQIRRLASASSSFHDALLLDRPRRQSFAEPDWSGTVVHTPSQARKTGPLSFPLNIGDLSTLLDEMTLLNQRLVSYGRFIDANRRSKEEGAPSEIQLTSAELGGYQSCLESGFVGKAVLSVLEEVRPVLDDALTHIQLPAISEETVSLVSQAVDDCLYVAQKSISRTVASGQLDCVCSAVNLVNQCLRDKVAPFFFDLASDSDRREGSAIPPACVASVNALEVGFQWVPCGDALQCLVDGTVILTEAVQDECVGVFEIDFSKSAAVDSSNVRKLKNCFGEFTLTQENLSMKFDVVLQRCLEHLRQKISATLTSVFESSISSSSVSRSLNGIGTFAVGKRAPIRYNIDEQEYAVLEANEVFQQRVLVQTNALVTFIKEHLLSTGSVLLFDMLVSSLTQQLERIIFNQRFSQLGALLVSCFASVCNGLQFDQHLRSLVQFLNHAKPLQQGALAKRVGSVRKHFSRLWQMASILNLDCVEHVVSLVQDEQSSTAAGSSRKRTPSFSDSAGVLLSCGLSMGEVRRVLRLRRDFSEEEIDRVITA